MKLSKPSKIKDNKNIKFQDLVNCNEKQVESKLKQDLKNLMWTLKSKDALKFEQNDEALLMVCLFLL